MSESEPTQTPQLESQRVPLEREVVLEFEHFSSFIREYSANISLGGMFVKTDKPHLPETVFRFEVRLADDSPLIAGLAKVLWVREVDDGADRPSGMGVRFLQLEEQGRQLIEQIVREHMARGGEVFDLDGAPELEVAEVEAPAPSPGSDAATESSVPRERSAVIDLPPLEDLLEEARTPASTLSLDTPPRSLDTPPRGWKPGIKVARPRTRPQLIAVIAAAAAIVGALIFLGVRTFSTTPVVDESETEPVALPRSQAGEGAEAELPPFTALEEITWQRAGNGAEIVVRLDGSLPGGSWLVERMSDPPRHLLRLVGASRPYPAETFRVGIGGVRQIRTGYHDTGAGNEQQVVIDLVDPRVVLEDARVEGPSVRLRFRRLRG